MLDQAVIFGLDRQGQVVLTEHLGETDPVKLKSLAIERLQQFQKVEVWVGAVCVIRLRQSP